MDKLEVAPAGADALQQLAPISQDDLWQELTDAVARGWPDRPEPLTGADVLRRLAAIASRVEAPPALRRQVIDDATGVLLLAFKHFKPDWPFNPWARRVLSNHAISLYRRERRMRHDTDHLASLESPAHSPAEDDLVEALIGFRRLTDAIRFPRPAPGGPDLGAVFDLETRLRLLAFLTGHGPEFLDAHFPLPATAQVRRIRTGWPTLGDLWNDLASSAEPGARHIDSLRCACRRLAPGLDTGKLHKTWNTWVHRAKRVVRRQLESSEQSRLFFALFPSHHRAASDPAGESTPSHPTTSRYIPYRRTGINLPSYGNLPNYL